MPALDLTETIEMTALVAQDRPGPSDRLMLWISNPVMSTAEAHLQCTVEQVQ